MDRRTHRTGQHIVEKRFILCLGMQEVSNLLTFQGGIQGRNIQNDADREIIFTMSQCPQEHWSLPLLEMYICNSLSVSNVYRKSQ